MAGYDTAIEVTRGDIEALANVRADGDVCVYVHGNGGANHLGKTDCNIYATMDGPSEEYFTITGVNDDGNGLCQLTLSNQGTGFDFTDINAANYVWVSGLDASHGASANGRWKPAASLSGNTVVLAGSACAQVQGTSTLNGPTVNATYTAGTRTLRLESGNLNIAAGQTVTGPGIPGGTAVDAVGYANDLAGVSQAFSATALTGVLVTFSSLAFSGGPGGVCSDTTGRCLTITAQERIDTGASPGGAAASGLSTGGPGCATAFLIGGFHVGPSPGPVHPCQSGTGATETIAGFDIISPFCYGYAICYHVANAYNARFISAGMDATPNLEDGDTAFALLDGDLRGHISFIGGKASKVGAGLVVNASGNENKCVSVSSQDMRVYEVDQGCLLARGIDRADTLMVADNAQAVHVEGYSPDLNIYKQDDPDSPRLASSVTDSSGIRPQFGSAWWGGHFTPGGYPPSVPDAVTVSGNDSVGRFVVGTPHTTEPVVTFSHFWDNVPVCRASDQSNHGAPLSVDATTSAVTISGKFSVGDTIAYACTGYSN